MTKHWRLEAWTRWRGGVVGLPFAMGLGHGFVALTIGPFTVVLSAQYATNETAEKPRRPA